MAFIGSTSKIKNTQNRSESVAETFCACRGQSGLSFKKRIMFGRPFPDRPSNFEEKQNFERF